MRRRIAAFIMVVIVAAGLFSGCAKEKESSGDNGKMQAKEKQEKEKPGESKKMGRYMEQEISMPALGENERIASVLRNPEGKMEVYAQNPEGIKMYQLDESMNWEEKKADWSNGDEIQKVIKESAGLKQVLIGEDDNYYVVFSLYVQEGERVQEKTYIFKSEKGEKPAKKLKMAYFEEKITLGDTDFTQKAINISVLENGNMVITPFFDKENIIILSGTDGKKLDAIAVPQQRKETISVIPAVRGNMVITINASGNAVIVYDTETKEIIREAEYELGDSGAAFGLKEDGTLLLGDEKGLHQLAKDGTLWETLIDGAPNTMGLPDKAITGIYGNGLQPEQYCITYDNSEREASNGEKIIYYNFDETIPAIPERELTVSSLDDNATVRLAINLFQKEHSDVRVIYHIAGGEGGTLPDYVKAMNTEILAGSGADVLILDGLPVDSYVEKGILADMGDVMKPMLESGKLHPGIAADYEKDGCVYAIPIRMDVPFILGNKEALENHDSLGGIADYVKKGKDLPYFSPMASDQLVKPMYDLNYRSLFDENNLLDKEAVKAFFEDLKTVSVNSMAAEEDMEGPRESQEGILEGERLYQYSSYDVLDAAARISEASIYVANRMEDFIIPVSASDSYGLVIDTLDKAYYPRCVAGLNKSGGDIELAKEFVAFMLEKEVQDVESGDGFPVNMDSLNTWMLEETPGDDGIFMSLSDNTSSVRIQGGIPPKERRQELLEVLLTVNKAIKPDQTIKEFVVQNGIEVLAGRSTIDQAVADIINKVTIYLAE